MADKKLQPEISIGLIGHVDHGKSTLVERLSGRWTDTHSEEKKRGITIRLGYADTVFVKTSKGFTTEVQAKGDKLKYEILRKISFIDAPGHETLMATMLSGAAIIDGAILLISANEPCPQPQTREHLMALELIGIKNIIIVQNKIDLVAKEEIKENYKQIQKFIKSTIAEKAPIIPISAQHNINIDFLIEAIEKNFKTPKRDLTKDPLMLIARSFDINKPGKSYTDLVGGVLGGALRQGKFKVGDEIEISPGLRLEEKGQATYKPIKTKITGIVSGNERFKEITPGGSLGVLTELDPSIVKSDTLAGNLASLPGKLPPLHSSLKLKTKLIKRVVGVEENLEVEPIKKDELLMLNVNSAVTVGQVANLGKNQIELNLRLPILASKEDHFAISRRIGSRWHLIGVGELV
ncbi:MAG: translation initiation factor IF-2 subunit gamma [Nanoarchaeota archaeon]|jgi:translation initiation factor 2 subunit 3|nr:translation initiation factor IF-2 subunit gamma [Nanoarchaeota archaeon]|tara:strand:- start:15620 stop:16840 length:1221 start_codon:yes stop_codon:yes gene_type:complete